MTLVEVRSEEGTFYWCPEGDLNPHSHLRPTDFKSAASANFAIRAGDDFHRIRPEKQKEAARCEHASFDLLRLRISSGASGTRFLRR
jgi:hypothetical protein